MADSLPSPPESRSSSPEIVDTGALTARLDELLEQYLKLLDQYTRLREHTSKTFSSGFFSLAQAQRASTLGAGRRYGEECYDERMKAQRKMMWDEDVGKCTIHCAVRGGMRTGDSLDENKRKEAAILDISRSQHNVQNREGEKTGKSKDVSPPTKTKTRVERPKQDPAERDPLTWYGILVPPALRQTQTCFVEFVDQQLPELLSIDYQMKRVEQEIWTTREQLGIASDYEPTKGQHEEKLDEQSFMNNQEPSTAANVKERISTQKSVVSRPAHSKSHLLQLGD